MSEPFLERLSRFTPDAGKLDRDALLFAAGRSSVRPNRGWKTLAAVLAGTQVLTLGLLWPHPTPPAAGLPASVAAAPRPVEQATDDARAHRGIWSPGYRMEEVEMADRPADAATLIDSGPPLRAFAPPPASMFN